MNRSGEYEPTGLGWLQYPGQEKQRVRIPQAGVLPASTAPTVDLASNQLEAELIEYFAAEDEVEPIDIDRMTEDEINELIDKRRTNKLKDSALNKLELAQKFLTYFREKGRQFADREGWVSITKLQQNWGNHNGFDAKQFRVLLNNLGSLGVGRFHPEDPDFWTIDEEIN